MKSFNEKDLITWYNREKAVIGNEYYFADCLESMECKIKKAEVGRLIGINDNEVTTPFENSGNSYLYACILPVDDVKKEKTYRACRSIREFYNLILNTKSKADPEFYFNESLGVDIHFRNKETGTEYFTTISTITKYINDYVIIVV